MTVAPQSLRGALELFSFSPFLKHYMYCSVQVDSPPGHCARKGRS